MAFFDKLSEKISSGAAAVSNSTKRMSEIAKLNGKINKNLTEVNGKYTEIGRIVKLELADKLDNQDIKRLISEINVLLEEVDESREKINQLKGVKLCPECGAQVVRDAAFCPNCGAKQAVEEQPTEASGIESLDIQDSEDSNNVVDEARPISDSAEQNAAAAAEAVEAMEKPENTCSQCGNIEESGTKFCSQCGNKMN